MSRLALVLPHREPHHPDRDCPAGEWVTSWPRINRCDECGVRGVLRVLLSSREAARKSGVTYATWLDFGVDRKRPAPDHVARSGALFWLPATLESWFLTSRKMQRATIRRILNERV